VIVIAQVVDWAALGKVIGFSLAGGVGVTLAYSLGILGAVRFAEMRRNERLVEAIFYAALGLLGLVVTIAAVVAGLIVMTSGD
jgi:hypothetical protein